MRSTILLLMGTLFGIGLAASGLLGESSELSLNAGAVAAVNNIEISAEQYNALVDAVAAEKKTDLVDEDYQFLLQKLIDEELIVQRGEELGFLQLNSVVRNGMVQAVINSITAEVAGDEVDDQTLAEFYQENQSFFLAPTKFRVTQLKFEEKNRAEIALKELQDGADYHGIKKEYAESEILKIPNILLPMNTLREYIGPTLLEAVNKVQAGEVSPLVFHQDKWHLFIVHQKLLAQPPEFEAIKEVVRVEYNRKRDEQAFRKYVEWLRQRAEVDLMEVDQLKLMQGAL